MKKPKQRIEHHLSMAKCFMVCIVQAISFPYFEVTDMLRLETENTKIDMNEVWMEMNVCKHQRNSRKKVKRTACIDQSHNMCCSLPGQEVCMPRPRWLLRGRPCTLTAGRQGYSMLQRPLFFLLPNKKIDCSHKDLYIPNKEKHAIGSNFA